MKVLVKLFQKLAECEAEPRKKRRFLLITFLLRLVQSKEKWKAVKATLMRYKGNPHLCVPLFRLWRNSPLVALPNAWGISPSAEGDQGAAFGNRKLLKKLEQNFHCFGSAKPTDKSKFEKSIIYGDKANKIKQT